METIKKCPLFLDIEEDLLHQLLNCLEATRRIYKKDEFIFRVEGRASHVGIVLSGNVHVLQEDFWGNRMILASIGPSGLFGEAFSCAGVETLPVSVMAVEKSEIMLLNCRKIVTTCSSACGFHTKLIANMLRVLAEKNIMLTRKLEHMSKRTTREKLLSFLSAEAVWAKRNIVEIPFDRQALADYLSVDRSALSRELSAMGEEGIIRFHKNRFELIRI